MAWGSASGGFIEIDTEISANTMGFKRAIRKVQNFIRYSASIGIHKADANKKVYRRYSLPGGGESTAGLTARMTVGKLAWQNEFGAHITIPRRYATYRRERTFEKRLSANGRGLLRRSRVWYFTQPARQIGYIIKSRTEKDKNGNPKWLAVFPVDYTITIPKRPVFRNFAQKKSTEITSFIQATCQKIFTNRGMRVPQGIRSIADYICKILKASLNAGDTKANSNLTVKIKGFDHPLVDEGNRVADAVKYKIYKDRDIPGTVGYTQWNRQQRQYLDKLLKSVQELENLGIKRSYVRVKSYTKIGGKWDLDKGVVNAQDKGLDVLYPRVQMYSPTLNSPNVVPGLQYGTPSWNAKGTFGVGSIYRRPSSYRGGN